MFFSSAVWAGLLFVSQTELVMLGTGNPNADPDRMGPSVAVVVNDTPYLVDFGPGVVRRAAAANRNGVRGLSADKLRIAFATHLHSDHTAGLADLFLTPAVLDRHGPLTLFGPKGIRDMAGHLRAAYRMDIENRTKGLERGDPKSYEIKVTENKPGLVYEDKNVRVKAFLVDHALWKEAYGYRFETPDKTIVISGDCTPSQSVIDACNGCDILVHEVYSVAGFRKRPEQWQKYHSHAHTSSIELGKLANQAKPKLLVLYHQLLWSSNEAELMEELRSVYQGPIRFANDLDVIR